MSEDAIDELKRRAYAAFDDGQLHQASRHFAGLLEARPDSHDFHYMRGLVHKYLRDWPVSLQHNLRAIDTAGEPDAASQWNAGIAATALGDWALARRQWQACGIRIPEGDGPIEADFGIASIRLNPWGAGETVFARRIDVVRARLLNVPLPESGHRFGDIVLHDGASTGKREIDGGTVPVFNALVRLQPSDFKTYAVFVACEEPGDLQALQEASLPGIGYVEDWTHTIVRFCLRCSYGTPHRHDEVSVDRAWNPERNLGIAAQSRVSLEHLLAQWQAGGRGRRIDGMESREQPESAPEEGQVWWREPDNHAEKGDADAPR